jgi:hypothetical protein
VSLVLREGVNYIGVIPTVIIASILSHGTGTILKDFSVWVIYGALQGRLSSNVKKKKEKKNIHLTSTRVR